MLTADQAARVTAALATADTNVAEALQLTPNGLEVLWANLIGAGSASSALVTDYTATVNLAAELHAKADRWRTSMTIVEDVEVSDFERAAGATSNEAAAAAAAQLSPGTLVRDVAAGIVSPSTWPPWVKSLAVGALAVAAAVVIVPAILAALLPRPGR